MEPKPFKPSKFTIKVKLVTIISILVITGLSGVIFLATDFFKERYRARIQVNNLELVDILGQKVEQDLYNSSFEAQVMASILEQKLNQDVKNRFRDAFFKNNPNFVYMAIAGKNGNGIQINQEMINTRYISDNNINPEIFSKINNTYNREFTKSFLGVTVVQNASAGFMSPLLGMSIPHVSGNNGTILILYQDAIEFLKAFQSDTGINTTYMINDRGETLAHPDSKLVLSSANLAGVPIVTSLLESKTDNGQRRYQDEGGTFHLGSYKKLTLAGLGIVSSVPEDEAFRDVYEVQRRNLYILGIVLSISVIFTFFFSRTLSIPITKLAYATKQVESGNYVVDLVPTTRDEVGSLTNSFKSMANGLEERERIKSAFGKFVNEELAEQALKGELKLGGERKNCAIFFSDIRSFTAISEKLQPEEVVEFLNEYMTAMVDCVNKTQGVVDKYIGDAIMATWGSIKPLPNAAENAVNGALMMRKALINFNVGRGGDKKPIIKIGCGLNYGPVIAGQIGSEERLEYTVIGDAVNLASRVEALNKPMGTDVLITSDLLSEVEGVFHVQKMQSIKVKGKEEPQTIYAVLGRNDDPECPQTIEEMRELVGIVYDSKAQKKSGGEEEVKYEILED